MGLKWQWYGGSRKTLCPCSSISSSILNLSKNITYVQDYYYTHFLHNMKEIKYSWYWYLYSKLITLIGTYTETDMILKERHAVTYLCTATSSWHGDKWRKGQP
jgi:hypothetical protein